MTCWRRWPHTHVQWAVFGPITFDVGDWQAVQVWPLSSVPPSARVAPQQDDDAMRCTGMEPGAASPPVSQSRLVSMRVA